MTRAEELEAIRARHEVDEQSYTWPAAKSIHTDRAFLLAEVERLTAESERLIELLAEIGDTAHHASTGPAVPDTYWDIRRIAYSGVEINPEPAQ